MSTRRVHESIWTRPEPGARKPRFTREQIAAVALRIADDEGFDAVSMRRVASQLGAGTMTLYHYVRTKDDLVALMDDALMAEVLIDPAIFASGWRAALTAIAHASRDAFVRHPWAMRSLEDAGFGPNGMRHFEQSLEALSGTGLSIVEQMEIGGIVDDYVFGSVLRMSEVQRSGFDDRPEAAAAREEAMEAAVRFTQSQLEGGEFPRITAWVGDDARAAWEQALHAFGSEERFDRGLQALLDGLAGTYGIDG